MKKLIIFVLLFVVPAAVLSAADTVESIRKLYREAAHLEKEEQCRHEVSFNTLLPAVGLQKTRVLFVFQSAQADPENDPYEMVHELKKVVVTWNLAASSFYKKEYLFGQKNEVVFFYVKKESRGDIEEKRYYFKNRKLLRLQTSVKSVKKSFRDIKKGTAARRAARGELKSILSKASSYRAAFQYLLNVEALK